MTVTQLFLKKRPEKSKIKYLKKILYFSHRCAYLIVSLETTGYCFVGLPAFKMSVTKLGHESKTEQLIKLNKAKSHKPHVQLYLAR